MSVVGSFPPTLCFLTLTPALLYEDERTSVPLKDTSIRASSAGVIENQMRQPTSIRASSAGLM